MRMAALIATCFSLSLLLGNICPMRLAAYAARPSQAEEEAMAMTPVHGGHMACRNQTLDPLPPFLASPTADSCASGHCLAKSDPTMWLQISLPSTPPAIASVTAVSLSTLNAFTNAPSLHFTSSTSPPPKYLRSVVLRI